MSGPFGANSLIEIMDTTLRDGEQTDGVSFFAAEKLILAKKLLIDVKVDRIEIASAKVSLGEADSCRQIFLWAKENNCLEKVEVLGFVDYTKSVDWVTFAGGKRINLLCKGSEKHCRVQLNKSKEEHFSDIKKTIEYAHGEGVEVNAYLEDFSNGIYDSKDYVKELISVLLNAGTKRIMLADTLGILSPEKTFECVSLVRKWFPKARLDFHGHNDYGLATANSLAAIRAGANGIHCTVNGLGERSGNTSLEEIIPAIKDFEEKTTNVNEDSLSSISKLVEIFSRQRVGRNKPIVGANVFTQTAGIHADGDKKGNLYKTKLSAERFGRKTRYALGKLSGKASVEMALRDLGISLEGEVLKKVLEKVVSLGDKKQTVTKEDLPFIITEVQSNGHEKKISVVNYEIISTKNKKPTARLAISVLGNIFTADSEGDGGYDAFMNALRKIFAEHNLSLPQLIDYEVRIPPGGKTDALVETKITWLDEVSSFETIGMSTDQVDAAIIATEKAVNFVANHYNGKNASK